MVYAGNLRLYIHIDFDFSALSFDSITLLSQFVRCMLTPLDFDRFPVPLKKFDLKVALSQSTKKKKQKQKHCNKSVAHALESRKTRFVKRFFTLFNDRFLIIPIAIAISTSARLNHISHIHNWVTPFKGGKNRVN